MSSRTLSFLVKGLVLVGLAVGLLATLPPDLLLPEPPIPSGQPIPLEPIGVEPGDTAPDFALPGVDGREMTLYEHQGQHKVLVNFFATWCEACRLEMPGLQRQYERHKAHGWIVIGISIMEPLQDVLTFQKEFGLTFPLLLDKRGSVTTEYAVIGTPTNITIDKDGQIIDRQLGYMSEADLEAMLCSNETSPGCD